MTDAKLYALLSHLRTHGVRMTPRQREAQRRSFAYGNTHLANPAITREMVDQAARGIAVPEELKGESDE